MNYERYNLDHLKSMRFWYIHTISNPCEPQMAEYVKRELEKLDKEISKRLQLTLQFPQEEWHTQ